MKLDLQHFPRYCSNIFKVCRNLLSERCCKFALFKQWKNFENRLRFNKVRGKNVIGSHFLDHSVGRTVCAKGRVKWVAAVRSTLNIRSQCSTSRKLPWCVLSQIIFVLLSCQCLKRCDMNVSVSTTYVSKRLQSVICAAQQLHKQPKRRCVTWRLAAILM